MVPPSGSLKASIACHLHCPSFTVSDPYDGITADDSNICVKQLLDIGFTPDQCLMFDHLSRREVLDGLQAYPKQILELHESFLFKLRSNMSAIVEVCWGRCVRERMMQLCNLTPLQLYGPYKNVQIWLEWEADRSQPAQELWRIVRFLVFVQHPQRMLYRRRHTLGVLQDLHLTVAAKLAGVDIDEHFYEISHKPGTYGRLTSWQMRRQQSLSAASTKEISICSPDSKTAGSYISNDAAGLDSFAEFVANLDAVGSRDSSENSEVLQALKYFES